MPIAQEILFPVDFSPSAAALVPAVASVARRLQLPVTLLHAVEALRPDLEIADSALTSQIEARASQKLLSFGGGDWAGLNVNRQVVAGPASQAIVECAGKMNAPLIMMPTHGESGFQSLLLGSVTASVLQDAGSPVWTSAHCEDGGLLPTSYSSIVCAVDMEQRTVAVLSMAAEFAADFGAVLHVVHAVPGIDPRFESATANRAHAFLIDRAREEYPAFAEVVNVSAPLEILEDIGLTDGIASAVARHQADLLVIGRGVSQGVLGRLRTNAHDLIRQSRCPVLSV
jgi:nucleotide-binding universal stress UspA family protein